MMDFSAGLRYIGQIKQDFRFYLPSVAPPAFSPQTQASRQQLLCYKYSLYRGTLKWRSLDEVIG